MRQHPSQQNICSTHMSICLTCVSLFMMFAGRYVHIYYYIDTTKIFSPVGNLQECVPKWNRNEMDNLKKEDEKEEKKKCELLWMTSSFTCETEVGSRKSNPLLSMVGAIRNQPPYVIILYKCQEQQNVWVWKKKKNGQGIKSKWNYGIYGTLHSWPLYLFLCSFLSFKAIWWQCLHTSW